MKSSSPTSSGDCSSNHGRDVTGESWPSGANSCRMGTMKRLYDKSYDHLRQSVMVQYAYDAWDKPLEEYPVAAEAYQELARLNPFSYRGYVYDEETEYYCLRSRYYDPKMGRFLNEDAILGSGELLSHNMFAYRENNLISCSDPTGYWFESIDDFLADLGSVVSDVTSGSGVSGSERSLALAVGRANLNTLLVFIKKRYLT